MLYRCVSCGKVDRPCEINTINVPYGDDSLPYTCPWGYRDVEWVVAQQESKVDLQTTTNK